MAPEIEEQEPPKKAGKSAVTRRRRIGNGVVATVVGVYVVLGLLYGSWNPRVLWHRVKPTDGAAFRPTFDGDSSKLANTQVVPTLDTPIESGKNAVWCATFTAAWKQGQQKITNGPIKITGAEEICARLNAAPDPASSLPAEAVYANAGFFDQGILNTIRKDMRAKFPRHTLPEFEDLGAGGFMFYSYLTAHVPFSVSYIDSPKPLNFTASDGAQTPIRSFGSSPSYGEYYGIRYQPKILMAQWQDTPDTSENVLRLKSFAVDLCSNSTPYQIVVARVARKESLAAMLDALNGDIAAFSGEHTMFECVLLVPNMAWRLAHHYRELERKPLENAVVRGASVISALQDIQFQLDKNGAHVDSEASVTMAPAPSRDNAFLLNGPFLLYIKVRNETTPFFAVWVDNAELLQRWGQP